MQLGGRISILMKNNKFINKIKIYHTEYKKWPASFSALKYFYLKRWNDFN